MTQVMTSHYAKKRDAIIVVTIIAVIFVLVEGHNVGIMHIMWYISLLPTEAQELMQVPQ